jgi:hypothetical protein
MAQLFSFRTVRFFLQVEAGLTVFNVTGLKNRQVFFITLYVYK